MRFMVFPDGRLQQTAMIAELLIENQFARDSGQSADAREQRLGGRSCVTFIAEVQNMTAINLRIKDLTPGFTARCAG
jgi:hypothetical protein